MLKLRIRISQTKNLAQAPEKLLGLGSFGRTPVRTRSRWGAMFGQQRRLQSAKRLPVHTAATEAVAAAAGTTTSEPKPDGGSGQATDVPERPRYDESARSYIGRFQSAISLGTHLMVRSQHHYVGTTRA